MSVCPDCGGFWEWGNPSCKKCRVLFDENETFREAVERANAYLNMHTPSIKFNGWNPSVFDAVELEMFLFKNGFIINKEDSR
jgi:hypothetical protein